MEKIVANGDRDCTIVLDGTECSVKFDRCFRAYSVQNDSASDVFVSIKQGASAGDDGVMRIKAGCSAVFAHMRLDIDTVYFNGTGEIQVHGQNDTNNSFRNAPVSGGGGNSYTKSESDAKYAQKTDVVPYKMGMDFGTCTTAAETVVKSVTTLHKVAPALGAVFAVKFNNAVPAQARLNINGLMGYIEYRGGSIPNGVINAGDIATFIYYSSSGFNTFEIISVENGGNADTVDGKHANDFMPYIGVVDDLFAVDKSCICAYGMNTLNTPLKAGLTESGGGLCFVNLTNGAEWANYIVIPSGDEHIYSATSKNGVLSSEWRRINDRNADTVGGKVPEKIFYDNGISADLNGATQSGCYAASPDTLNAPSSSWWLVDTMNFNNQFIVQKAHTIGGTTTVSYIRNYANDVWSEWKEISTTPIKSTTFSSTADGTGNFNLWAPSENKVPISIQLDNKTFYAIPFLYNNQMWLGNTINEVTRQPVTDTTVSGTVYYI